MPQRIAGALPYFVVIAIAAVLFVQLGDVKAASPGALGPASWPKAILMLTVLSCAYEGLKRLLARGEEHDAEGVLEGIVEDAGEQAAVPAAPEKRYRALLWLGIGCTVAYVALIETLGFFLSTWIYLAAFMWVGRFRRPRVVLAVSLGGALVFSFVFMKLVYISLPLGAGPFRSLSLLLMQVMAVR